MHDGRELPPYRAQEGIRVGLGAWVTLITLLVFLAGAVAVALRDLRSIAARDEAIAQARACGLPKNPGDRVVLVVHNRGGTLVATCRPVADLMSPEKGIKE